MRVIKVLIALAIIVIGFVICALILKNKKAQKSVVVSAIIVEIVLTLGVVDYIKYLIGEPAVVIERILNWTGLADSAETTATPYIEPTFNNRSSEQFNYTIDCPSNFVIEGGKGQDTEDDFNLSSPDRKATLNFTARIIDGTLPDKFTIANFRKTYAGTEMYCDDQLESDGWYAISTKAADGAFHYRKCIFTDGIVRMYTFSFPTEQEDVYLSNFDYVSHIEKSFRKLY